VTPAPARLLAFKPPVRPAVPELKSAWAKNDIDRFVLAKLDEKHLKPVADADKHALIRRVTYDLTGLPPTPAEVDAFVSDRSPLAYEHLVDRLLASKAYGERWGRIWLDVVRYADTSGGGATIHRQAAKVSRLAIDAFNRTSPYDRFIKEQIAGDLLPARPNPSTGQYRRDRLPRPTPHATTALSSTTQSTTSATPSGHDRRLRALPRSTSSTPSQHPTTTPSTASSRALTFPILAMTSRAASGLRLSRPQGHRSPGPQGLPRLS